MSDAIRWYDTHVSEVTSLYESVASEAVHRWLIELLPQAPALVLDVGAGTGRDAAWLAERGYEVVAAEPSSVMRAQGQQLHAETVIHWVADSLPDLEQTLRLGLSFDLILLSAVWMHVPPNERRRAFRKLVTLLKPTGLIAITLRQGPAERARGFYPTSPSEIGRLSREHGAFVERTGESQDKLGRPEVTWTHLAIRLPDDGSGALPLLRHIILNDDKSSTYKLALLRVLCRIADGASGYARDVSDDNVAVPLGLAALYWIRLFKPLLAADLPQNPTNRGYERLDFVKEGFRRLGAVSPLDLKVGSAFSGDLSTALHQSVRDACATITKMPARYMSYPNGGQVLPVQRVGKILKPGTVRLDEVYLFGFGEMLVPRHLWRALQRFDVWIEPALTAEWARLMKFYAERQGRKITDEAISQAMTWSEPSRDVRIAREQALRLIVRSELPCVWTGQKLTAETLDVDHCFPWAVWPCDDLWNLLPAHRRVNQRLKRDRLPSVAVLRSAHDRIRGWWEAGYLKIENSGLPERFKLEARASLPGMEDVQFSLDDLFAGLNLQQVRLKHDQQAPEWDP